MGPPSKKMKFQNKKKFYQPSRKQYLEAGFKGFIATCNFNERDCVRECYNVLNHYANELYGPEDQDPNPETGESNTEPTDDIADELQKQIEAMQQKSKSFTKRRFQVVDTGATNCVFIKTILPDPIEIAGRIIKDIAETKKQKTRYLLRLVPVEIVCKANIKDIIDSAGQLCDNHFLSSEPTTFSIVFNKRFNNDINRDTLIKELADIIHAKNVKHKVDLKYAKKSLIVEVIKGLCCLAVVDSYMAMKKYNLVELARANQEYDKKESQIQGEEKPEEKEEMEQLKDKEEKEQLKDKEEKEPLKDKEETTSNSKDAGENLLATNDNNFTADDNKN